jgi:hypothetical protein
VKRKLSSRAPGRSLSIQIRQALLLGLAFNLYRLRHSLVREDVNRAINTYGFFASVDSDGFAGRYRKAGAELPQSKYAFT